MYRVREGDVQLRRWVGLLDFFGDLGHHLGKLGAVGGGEALGVRFLEEPELFEGHDGVAAGDFEVELLGVSGFE